ncbi:MAG: DUF3021 family protein [Atopobium sp.]|jgi:hypothetical protein|uniref:DUF3021 family protein n=1 Tax=Atopobium sp. ICM42b TaxID=1190620 RepID=UPI00045015C2|nr:DUF3021 family protein [Atopobium sp. ICM42b]EWC94064.1 hypothetical protein HMPREF1493_0048 [Atopobium sp. ICM42b]MBS6730465.1 DUF3021 family protein [Atopobium sp.]MDU5217679.1 DUF3021 family protein [Atopobium sp.]
MERNESQNWQGIERKTQQEFDEGLNKTVGQIMCKGISGGAICFTGISLVYGVIALATNYGDRQNNIILLTLIAAGVLSGIYQQIWFNYQPLITKLSYLHRFLGFNVCLFPTLVAMALIGGWVPNMAQAWMSFTALYLVILLVTTLFFNAMFKKEEQKYKAAFEKYQASRRG